MKVRESRDSERLYHIWNGMIHRCNDESCYSYKNYGGRGISICDKWLDFSTFYEWAIENGYENNLTIERIDVNGGYCPQNCTWVTKSEQNRNKRDNRMITVNGVTKLMCDWASIYGIKIQTLSNRINIYGWDEELAVITPVKNTKRNQSLGYEFLYKEYVENKKRVKDIEKETGVPKSTIHREIQRLGIHR